MVETPFDRDQCRQQADSADVVVVVVREDQRVDLPETRHPGRDIVNPAGIAAVLAPAGIDEQRLARRRHHERRGAAFDVNPVDVERTARLRPSHRRGKQRCGRRAAGDQGAGDEEPRPPHGCLTSTVSRRPFEWPRQ